MNRRKFALSWGRKLFFGLSWPLSLLLGLVYLRSSILPETTADWVFFVTSFIGIFGLLNALAYFIIFVPIVALMPSYYVSRFLSLILILALNLFITLDALTFANYHQHVYGFLSQLIIEKGVESLIGSTGMIILGVAVAILALLIWLRGEMIWRGMQGRFSNPVKNWYLVIIVLFILIAKGTFYYGELHPKMAEIFPLDQNIQKTQNTTHDDNRKFYYPSEPVVCQGKANPNIILITLKEWSNDQLNPDTMPSVSHMKRHAVTFNSLYGVSFDSEGGLFSLMYSVPASYKSAATDKEPVIYSELAKRKYEIQNFSNDESLTPSEKDEKVMRSFRQWIDSNTGEEISPRFLSFVFNQHSSDVDKYIQEIILNLQKEDFLAGSHIVITGTFAGRENSLIPLMYIHPDRRSSEVNSVASQYDVMPTIMQKAWNCKNTFKVASVGLPFDEKDRDWLLVTNQNSDFKIIDFKSNNITTVFQNNITDAAINESGSNSPRRELIFPALKMMTSFSKFK